MLNNKSKVLLIYPKIAYFPINFAYIFPCLKRNQIAYDFIDLNINPEYFDDINFNEYSAVATGGLIGHFFMMSDLFRTIKQINPTLPLILGGRVTGAPEHLLKDFPADYFIFGDADPALPNLLHAILNHDNISEIKGIAYRNNEGIFTHTCPEKQVKLDNFTPDWDDIDIEHYLSSDEFPTGGYYSDRSYPIIIGMGCIGTCVFCNPVIKGFRIRPPESVVKELVDAKRKYNITSFFIDSEIFYLKLSEVYEFCDLLNESNLNLPFAASIRADSDPRIVNPLSNAGCKTLMIGIESYDNDALKAMKKNISTDDIDRIVNEAKKNKINLIAGFLVGNPGDTEESLLKTAEYIINNDIVCPIKPIGLMIYPSTANYLTATQRGLITDEWKYFKKFCNFDYSIRISENGIGSEFPNLTSLSNDELWKAYSKVCFKLYNYFMSNKVLRNAQLDKQTANCSNCNQTLRIKKPVWIQLCPNCGYANYCDIHMMSLVSEMKEIIQKFCDKNNNIAIAGTYHFKMSILKLCLDCGKKSKDLLIVEDNEQPTSFFKNFFNDLRVIKSNDTSNADAVIYAGLFQPKEKRQELLDNNINEESMLNATPVSFKKLHKDNLYNLSYFFEFTEVKDLQTYGKHVSEYLIKRFGKETYWVLYSNCPLGAEIARGILSNPKIHSVEYSQQHKLLDYSTKELKCLITTTRMTGYSGMLSEISQSLSISENNILCLKNDIFPSLWPEMFISESI